MILTFCGHSDYAEKPDDKERLLSHLEERIGNRPVDFYLGGYGAFDRFALRIAILYRKNHKNAAVFLVTPYPDRPSVASDDGESPYDQILYPGLETVPKRFAIVKRNEWMIRQSDYVICYVKRRSGGAFHAFSYAVKQKKPIFNLFPDFQP